MKKKILFYFFRSADSGGSDNSLFYHITNLDKSKFESFVIYRYKGDLVLKLEDKVIFTLRNKFLVIRHMAFENENSFISKIFKIIPYSKTLFNSLISFFEIIFLTKIILQKKIDIVHLNHSLRKDRPALLAGILTRKKVFSHYRGLTKLNQLDAYLSNFVDKIICISGYSRQNYIDNGIAPDKCVTIYNGVDMNRFSFKEIKKNKYVHIGNIGRVEVFKGQHILIKAIPDIIKVYPDIRCFIVGKGDQNDLIKLADDLKIKDYISFSGAIDKVEDVYKNLDILIFTTLEREFFGRVIIEAMATGLPVISTNIGGPKEIITDGHNGFLIPPGDSEILAEKIIYLIENPDIRHQIGRNALETVKKRFDIKFTTQQIETLYNSV